MPAVASLVINDGQATPVAHTFIPLGPDKNGVWWFEDQSPSAAILYKKISVQLTRTTLGAAGQQSVANRVNRLNWAIHDPVGETLGTNDAGLLPPASLGYLTRAMGSFLLPERGVLQNRKDSRSYAANLLVNSNFTAIVDTLQNYY